MSQYWLWDPRRTIIASSVVKSSSNKNSPCVCGFPKSLHLIFHSCFSFVHAFLAYSLKIRMCELCVSASPLLTFEFRNQFLWNLVRITWHLSPSQRRTSLIPPISLCVYMCISPTITKQRLFKHVPAVTNTRNIRRIVGSVIFYVVRV
jgi:hypothetical protein